MSCLTHVCIMAEATVLEISSEEFDDLVQALVWALDAAYDLQDEFLNAYPDELLLVDIV